MRQVFIHLGYPKTGTTSLQKQVFDELHKAGRIFYLGMFSFKGDDTPDRKVFFTELLRAMYLEDSDSFDAVLPDLTAKLRKLLREAPEELPIVLSNEHFTLSQKSTKVSGQSITPQNTFRRLAKVFESYDVRLLLCLRRQDDLAQALFLEHYSRADNKNFSDFSNITSYFEQISDVNSLFSRCFNFDGVISAMNAHFPNAPNMIWLFEDFRDQNAEIVDRICRWIGVSRDDILGMEGQLDVLNSKTGRAVHVPPTIKRLGKLIIPFVLRKRVNDVAPRILRFFLSNRKLYFTPEQKAYLQAIWSDSNRRVAERNEELKPLMEKYGYFNADIAKKNLSVPELAK